MQSTVKQSSASVPVRSLEDIRPKPVSVGLRSDFVGPDFITVTRDAIVDHYGSVKATAYHLGEGAGQPRLDESLMQREFKAGNFSRLRFAAPEALGAVAAAQFNAFGPLASSPLARVLRLLDQIVENAQEARQGDPFHDAE